VSVLEAVFFDVDDTLVDFDTANVAAFRALFGDLDFGAWSALTAELYPLFTSGQLAFDAMREQRVSRFLHGVGRPVDAATARELEVQRLAVLAESYVLFHDVQACLDTLRTRGLKLGLITNNESVHQRAKLARTGLDVGFEAVVISGEVGVAKPERAIFEQACALLGVAPGRALHIGDNIETDVRGARSAGIEAVWLDRHGPLDHRHDEVRALGASVVNSLAEVPDLIGRLPPGRPHPDGALESRERVR
jgi:putative hydrolase of the HAD superfamily